MPLLKIKLYIPPPRPNWEARPRRIKQCNATSPNIKELSTK